MSEFALEQESASKWFAELRNAICNEFEVIELEYAIKHNLTPGKFERKQWNRTGGGGGEMSIMRGNVFEKVGVNISTVYGEFTHEFSKEIPGTEHNKKFWASGVSLVAHMCSPHVPAVHMNTRFITTAKTWFGGGADLTPTIIYQEDQDEFHAALRAACDNYNSDYYPKFKEECDKYFFLRHRGEPRGVGGIFYDYHNTGNWQQDLDFTKDVGKSFLEIYPKLVRKRMNQSWTSEEREMQLIKRGRYVEFNLLYDRGTRFGLMTDGNVEAILMSLPPEVKWI